MQTGAEGQEQAPHPQVALHVCVPYVLQACFVLGAQAPPLVDGVPHPVHPFASTAQLSSPPVTHWVAFAVHAFVQQEADPGLPVHAPLVHATGVPYAKHPSVPVAQVARPPVTQAFCPEVQLFVHVAEHDAAGAEPEQDSDPAHVVVAET